MSSIAIQTQTTSPDSTGALRLKPWNKPPPSTADVEYANIETVDLSLWDKPGGKAELAATVGRALTRDGFFYVINHTFSQEEVDRIFSIGQVPFDEVPDDEKHKYEAKIKEKGTFRGYKLPSFWEIENGVRDRIEHYNFYNERGSVGSPDEHPTALRPFLPEITAFLARSREQILRRILALISLHLQLPDEDYLWRLHKAPDGREGRDLFRFMVYDPLQEEEAKQTNGVYLKGHTDFNTISILFSQPITSLQILMPNGEWAYAKHRPNGLVVNIGDQLSLLSGGVLRATVHRVVRPPEDQVSLRRLGVFHFAHAIDDTPLLPLYDSPIIREKGVNIFKDKDHVPTAAEWESARIASYGVVELKKGQKWDTEVIAGVEVKHYK
ncbi:Clavaminate synthase-like protein [Laetiporus sulphureus 93-53]|uniref:Clavaminate synthase-like protein n=1 Tax=Laetiporus sulphureus 93-53 TaxID=1314785 RepID=A0A165EZW9_9APHY|nr:Clavaminate synthase-like protein [Laetiporus sulphureus 93-53]KZT08076.1 Clavaminate synthase-like protein [Laetiporus sulphureus 93-53]